MAKSEKGVSTKLKKEIDIANKLSKTLDKAVSDENQFYRHIVKGKSEDGKPITEEILFDKMDMESFNDAIKALKSLEEIKRTMYGIMTPAEERRLENEKAKQNPDTDKETGIVMLPEIEEEENET